MIFTILLTATAFILTAAVLLMAVVLDVNK